MALTGMGLGTTWRVRCAATAEDAPASLHTAIMRRLAMIVAQMSQWEPDSLLSRFNRAPASTWFTLPEDFATVMTAALDLAECSAGAFDPTQGRAAALLGYGADACERPPSPAALYAAHAAAGWMRLDFDRQSRRLRQPGGLWLDLSGIAKGYAVDAIVELLRARGIEDALVEIGGELRGEGLKPDGQPWWVDIEDPPGCPLRPLRIALHGLAVATSGDYVRGAHTLDPRTGQSLAPDIVAATVVHESTMLADGWATALTVAGSHAAVALADGLGLPARIVTRNGHELLSRPLSAMLDD
jgi:thiamine biosynthesis lipoprotein